MNNPCAVWWRYSGETMTWTVMERGSEVSYCIQQQAWCSLEDCPSKQQRQQLPKKTLPNLLCNYLYCTVFRYYIPPSLPSTHHRHLGPVAIKLKLFAFSDITITSASFGMCLTDLICASHVINSLRHLIFNLSALRLRCFFPSPFIPLLQAPQCTRSPQRQANQDICRQWKQKKYRL